MSFEWAEWGPPLIVLAIALVAGLALALRSRASEEERQRIAAEGRRVDLEQAKSGVLEQLAALEAERDKLSEEDYQRQHAELVQRGAAAMRALEESDAMPSPPTSAPDGLSDELLRALDADKQRLGEARFRQALATAVGWSAPLSSSGISPQWRGALSTLVVVAVAAALWFAASGDSGQRAPGASITGRGSVAEEGAATPAAARPRTPDKESLEARLAEDPGDLEALNLLTDIALAEQDLQAAMAHNRTALEVAPENPDARVNRAALQIAIGMRDRAITQLDEVISEHPTHIKALVYRGMTAMRDGDYEVAVSRLQQAVDAGGGDAFVQDRLKKARQALGGAGEAAEMPPESAGSGEVLVAGTVELPAELSASLQGGETLFIGVKNPAMPGPPLAALKLPATEFPARFVVRPSDVLPMHRGRPLPDTLDVSAQIDRDGNAMTREDNLAEGDQAGVSAGRTDLSLQLSAP